MTGSNLDDTVYNLILSLGSCTINMLASKLKRKHETIGRACQRLEENGRVYSEKVGARRYYTARPISHIERVRPAPEKREIKTDPYGRGSVEFPIRRARSQVERIPTAGFVLHPLTKGADVGRDWVRAHINGEYQIKVLEVGDFKPYNKLDDDAIEWKRGILGVNPVYRAKVYLHDTDTVPYSIRAVETTRGAIETLSVFIHPRYVYYDQHGPTAYAEFSQQVRDVCNALAVHGWRFDLDSIEIKGQLHTAINDPVLGSKVGRYNQTPGDPVHYDHSHGIPECEIYGDDPQTVELMVRLPDIIRAMSESIQALNENVNALLEVQTKTVMLFTKPLIENKNDIMYR